MRLKRPEPNGSRKRMLNVFFFGVRGIVWKEKEGEWRTTGKIKEGSIYGVVNPSLTKEGEFFGAVFQKQGLLNVPIRSFIKKTAYQAMRSCGRIILRENFPNVKMA
jgi:hypothetical protein